jgi:hypothetical protein
LAADGRRFTPIRTEMGMTGAEAFDLISRGGAADFARVVAGCGVVGAWCLVGDQAVNAYVEPVYSLDVDFGVVSAGIGGLADRLRADGFDGRR